MINRLLVWLGLREPPPMYNPVYFEAYIPGLITRAFERDIGYPLWTPVEFDVLTAEGSTLEEYDCDRSTSVK